MYQEAHDPTVLMVGITAILWIVCRPKFRADFDFTLDVCRVMVVSDENWYVVAVVGIADHGLIESPW